MIPRPTIIVVPSSDKFSKLLRIISSVSVSTADKQSSNNNIFGLPMTVLVIDTRCFCPPDKVIPRSPKTVS